MEKINSFVKYFVDEKLDNIIKIKKSYFLVDKELENIKVKQEPFAIGLFLGEIKDNKFVPSSNLLNILAKKTEKKIFISKKTEWLFLCGRDIFGKGIIRSNVKQGKVLVQNEKDENLGYGSIVGDLSNKESIVVKNIYDKGEFLRKKNS